VRDSQVLYDIIADSSQLLRSHHVQNGMKNLSRIAASTRSRDDSQPAAATQITQTHQKTTNRTLPTPEP